MLENLRDVPEGGSKLVKYKMRVRLRDGAAIFDVVPHDAVGERKRGGRTVRKMTDDHRVGLTLCSCTMTMSAKPFVRQLLQAR